MRSQDVKLMKQLIGINESIQSLTKARQQRSSVGARMVSAVEFSAMSTPLVRQQSAPSYNKLHRNDSMGSVDSFEGTLIRNTEKWYVTKNWGENAIFEQTTKFLLLFGIHWACRNIFFFSILINQEKIPTFAS
jgi:hypothetical protein